MPRDRGEEQTSLVVFWVIVASIFALDQLTKFLALNHLASVETVPVISGIFHLTLVHNTGIAFGFFNNSRILLIAAITVSLIVLAVWGVRGAKGGHRPLESAALALILGGAIGNWLDRIRYGAVVDFFDFRVWPVFNVADSAITIGVCLYLLILLRKPA
jgi:signal peptidase II